MRGVKSIVFIILIVIVLIPTLSFSKPINIVTTLNFLEDITTQIGKDRVKIVSILTGIENPHTYEAKPKDIIALSKADIFIEIGSGLEGFVDKILKNVKKKDLKIVILTEDFQLINNNPHIWLDPENGKKMAEKIANALISKSPENRKFFEENLNIYLKKIDDAEEKAKKNLDKLSDKRVVSSLPTYIYFYKRFKIKEMAKIVDGPGHRPSLKRIKKIISLIKKEGIPYIVTNPFIKVKSVKIIIDETNVKEVKLVPLLYKPFNINTYIDMIEYNGRAFSINE